MKFSIFVIFTLILTGLECSKILVLYPTISKSHIMPLQALAVLLAERGHDITFVSTYPLGKQVKNYRDVEIPFNEADKEFVSEVAKDPKGKGFFYMFPRLTSLMLRLCNETLQMKEMKRLMTEEKFDLVIVGYFVFTESMLGVADHFKCPSISFSAAGNMGPIGHAMGNPMAVSGTPHVMAPVEQMNFVGRLKTFLMGGVELLAIEFLKYKSRQVYDFNFPSDRYRSYEESLRNISLVLINSHFSSTPVRPFVPSIIEIGGIQVKQKSSPVPENLKTFLDGAKEGAVLFSLGSNAKSTFLTKETITTLLQAFSQVKQKVVMKWEADTLEGKPDNVFISKWLPQDDVLAHPNIKAFISHCGFGGVVEAKYHGVPIIGLPLFADQDGNAENIVKEGWGVKLDIATMTVASLKEAIAEVLTNSKIISNVKKASMLAKDRPLDAQDTAVFWVEYVLRHRGAPHLHFPGADLNILQYNSIDVILFIVATIYVVFKSIAFVCKKICCGRKKPEIKTKKQKKN